MGTPIERILRRTMCTDQCWIWLGSRTGKGYGEISVENQSRLVHRVAHEALVGPIPDGYVVDHSCHDPKICVGGQCPHRLCVNPDHLTLATTKDNTARQTPAAKTHCVHGHKYDELTTGRTPNGRRYCKACRSEGARAASANRRTAHSRAKDIRSWAAKRGIPVSSRGRIPQAITDAYERETSIRAA